MSAQVFAGSINTVRFLVEKGHADVNAPTANSGLTPLMCAALCKMGFNVVSNSVTKPARRQFSAETS